MNVVKSLCRQRLEAELAGQVRFKALPGTGCAKHGGNHYVTNRRCCGCDAEAKRVKRKAGKSLLK